MMTCHVHRISHDDVTSGSLNTDDSNQLVYMKRLLLRSVRANITFYTVDEENENTPLRMMFGSAASTIPNIEDAPIRMNDLMLNHLFCSQVIRSHQVSLCHNVIMSS